MPFAIVAPNCHNVAMYSITFYVGTGFSNKMQGTDTIIQPRTRPALREFLPPLRHLSRCAANLQAEVACCQTGLTSHAPTLLSDAGNAVR